MDAQRNIKLIAIFALVSSILIGCSSTGGTLGNLIPLPKILNGKLEGNTYHAPDESFQVNTPHPAKGGDTYEWNYAKVKEGVDQNLRFVEFGPFALDLNTYSVDFIKRPAPGKIRTIADEFYKKQLLKDKNNELIKEEDITINGNEAAYAVIEGNGFYYVSTFVKFHSSYANVYAIAYPHSSRYPDKAALTSRNWKIYNEFVSSLQPNM